MSCDDNNRYKLEIWQGSTFSLTITVKDAKSNVQNITGYDAMMQIRSGYDAANATETMSVSNGEITIDGANGNVYIELAATRTANIPVDVMGNGIPPKSIYVYDLELVDNDGKVSKLLYGTADVYAEVTR